MSVFIRRFLQNPGNDVLLNIESVNILDLTPPATISGIGTGTVLVLGEFEDGPYATPTEVESANDLSNNFGDVGFNYGGVPGNYPCAVQRFADSAPTGEFWNGNSAIQLNGKQFANLIVCRADTHVGNVLLTPKAFITGAAAFRYVLAAGQVLGLDVGAGPQTATFTATAATVTSGAQTFPSTFAGGETLTLGVDGLPNFAVTFLSTDQTQAAVISRINSYAGFSMAASSSGTVMTLTGLQLGNQAQVRVVSGTTLVLTQLGLSVATTFGTGNVANVTAVTSAEIATVVTAAISNTLVEVDQNGALRISQTQATIGTYVSVTSATTALNLGFTLGMLGTYLGIGAILSTAGTYPIATAGTFIMTYDNGAPFVVTLTTTLTISQVISAINTAANATIAVADSTTRIYLHGIAPGGNVTIVSASAPAIVTQLGLAVGKYSGVPLPTGTIPAGTIVQDASMLHTYVTAQSVVFGSLGVTIGGGAVATSGPWTVPIRPAVDNGTLGSANAGTIITIPTPPLLFSLTAINLQAVSAALTEAAIDAAYVNALSMTTDINSVAKLVNIAYSARQSNAIRSALRQNALSASANGCYGRVVCIRPPLGTLESTAMSTTAAPGVGATRDQRVIYCYPGFSTFVPVIAQRGVAGGLGFTFDGNIDVGADGFMASILSQLPPEENPGQETAFTGAVNGLESSNNVQGFQITDYILFKAAGIAAARMDDGVAIFQSGVTSVDPLVYPQLTRISRRRMADFIQDSIAIAAKQFGKKLSTNRRRAALSGEIKSFMEILLSRKNPDNQRIAGYSIDSATGNTDTTFGQGLYFINLNVRTLSSLDSIVIATSIGEQVQVTETLPAAA